MNFPDLETCHQISAEFQTSEFVWVDRNERAQEDAPGEVFLKVIGGGPLAIAWRSKTNCKIIAPAPTCEELGQWLFDHKALVSRFSIFRTGWRLLTPDIEETVEFEAPNETQARAQAVKMVMDALKSNNEED